MPTLQEQLTGKILSVLPPARWRNHSVLIAVSGGPDSTALLRLSHSICNQVSGSQLTVAHANHKLRGKESEQDQEFVQQLAADLGIPCHVQDLPPSAKRSDGLESDLRTLRYQWLRNVAYQSGARYVFTGHNQNDQTETVLFRLFRGTGISGLAGIPLTRMLCDGVTLVRPMLSASREAIIQYLDQIQQDYRIDATNAESQFSRNKIRNELIPKLKSEFSPTLDLRLQSLSRQATEHMELLDELTQSLLEKAIQVQGDQFSVRPSSLSCKPRLLVRHLLHKMWQQMGWSTQDMTFEKWDRLADFLLRSKQKGQTSWETLPGNISVRLDADGVFFKPLANQSGEN